MPREQRKRGRKHKKGTEGEAEEPAYQEEQEQTGEPSWIVQSEAGPSEEHDANYPFGVLDPDVKAYFRMVDDKLKGWQSGYEEEDAGLVEGEDPNETRKMFLNAALEELNGKELQLATDPECSVILERMMHSMDDFSRRVLFDRLSGAFTQLACHRFASHVCQTLVTLSADTVSRECRGILPKPSTTDEEAGILRTMTELIKAAYDELLPALSSVVMDHFGSHVLGALLILLCGDNIPLSISATSGLARSKKSTKYRAKQGPMTAIIDGPDPSIYQKKVPVDFPQMAIGMVKQLREQMDANSVRSLASHKAANPLMQLMLQVEARAELADEEGSIMDSFLGGLIGDTHNEVEDIQASDYVETMLRDATASHILEAILTAAPESVINKLWDVYFKGKLAKLCVHPVANFVVASAVSRLSAEQLEELWEEMNGRWAGILKHSRTGALRSAIIRATEAGQGGAAVEAVKSAFGITDETEKKDIVPCMLTCMSYSAFKDANLQVLSKPETTEDAAPKASYRKQPDADPITMQGSLLLQALLRLPSPSNELIISSLESLPIPQRLALAHHATSARVIDALLESPTVPHKNKRQWITAFLGHYQELVDDRIGSRVGDLCWAKADTFLKEKIARSLLKYETFLAASHYGRFFARKMRFTLLQRKPEEWKAAQSAATASAPPPTPAAPTMHKTTTAAADKTSNTNRTLAPDAVLTKKRKARAAEADEIDALFSAGPKLKRPKPAPARADGQVREAERASKATTVVLDVGGDKSLAGVLDAIKETRTGEKGGAKPKKKRKEKT
ncbi:ARM repeat-containing protein [Calocera cornea HHB12733]|uniref:Nucleolar protein 9 n=1 Tax=Calocera cornea HHB12733 TaxID=1353952 RepID=A0A165EQE4_9BASI|nr:ARM repeat-containing protein [Calocera cornea HHB12733]